METLEKETKEFWSLYDTYTAQTNENQELRTRLSQLLSKIENKDRKKQLLRPDKGWSKILGWQVLRNQIFYIRDTQFDLYEGEILAWTPHWDRDVFLTRLPYKEVVSGSIIRPSYKVSFEDKGSMPDEEWAKCDIADETGLYLPIYEVKTLLIFCDQQIAKIKPRILQYLSEEKGIVM